MKVIKDLNNFKYDKKSILLIGKFDGFHLGHNELIDRAISIKKETNLDIIVLSFYPNLFNIDEKYLMDSEEKKSYLESKNIDYYIEIPLDNKLCQILPNDFIREYICNLFHAKYLIEGTDFTFGKEAKGDINLLKKFSEEYGYLLEVVDKKFIDDIEISTQNIKSLITSGKIETANKLLGYNYSISGKVSKGSNLGTTINIPTLNIINDNKVLPLNGVYKTQTLIDGKLYDSITNVGNRPTFNYSKERVVETHLINFNELLYNKDVRTYFLQFIRPEIKFENQNQVKEQILKDIKFCGY